MKINFIDFFSVFQGVQNCIVSISHQITLKKSTKIYWFNKISMAYNERAQHKNIFKRDTSKYVDWYVGP